MATGRARGKTRRRTTALRPVLRLATKADWRVLVAHRVAMFAAIGGPSPRQLRAHEDEYRRWLLPRIRTGEVAMLIWEPRTGAVAASGGIWFRPEQPRPGAARTTVPYVFSMYTEPPFRRKGLARRLVREMLRLCRARGYRRVVLHAAPQARRMYRRLGFERSWEMRVGLRRP